MFPDAFFINTRPSYERDGRNFNIILESHPEYSVENMINKNTKTDEV